MLSGAQYEQSFRFLKRVSLTNSELTDTDYSVYTSNVRQTRVRICDTTVTQLHTHAHKHRTHRLQLCNAQDAERTGRDAERQEHTALDTNALASESSCERGVCDAYALPVYARPHHINLPLAHPMAQPLPSRVGEWLGSTRHATTVEDEASCPLPIGRCIASSPSSSGSMVSHSSCRCP